MWEIRHCKSLANYYKVLKRLIRYKLPGKMDRLKMGRLVRLSCNHLVTLFCRLNSLTIEIFCYRQQSMTLLLCQCAWLCLICIAAPCQCFFSLQCIVLYSLICCRGIHVPSLVWIFPLSVTCLYKYMCHLKSMVNANDSNKLNISQDLETIRDLKKSFLRQWCILFG